MSETIKPVTVEWRTEIYEGVEVRGRGTLKGKGMRRVCEVDPDDFDNEEAAETYARRLAAAWNATREIPVEALESGAVAEAFRLLWEFHAHIDREVHGAKLREIDSRLSTLLSRLPTSEVATTKEPVSGHVPLVPECRHKFVDSKHCLKCGWMPTSEVER